MTSQQQGNSLQTLCKDCVFSIKQGKSQSGCRTGILSKFKDTHVSEGFDEEGNEFYVIKGICQHYRPTSWGEADIQRMKDELKLTFTILVDVQEYDENQLKKLAEDLHSIFYYEKVEVIIAHKPTYEHKRIVVDMMLSWLGRKKFKVVQYHNDLTVPEANAELLRQMKNDGFFSMSKVDEGTLELMMKINQDFCDGNVFIVANNGCTTFVMSSALRFCRLSENKTYYEFEKELVEGATKANLYRTY